MLTSASAEVHNPYYTHQFNNSRILLVGDSHTWLSGVSNSYPKWDVDAQPGRSSSGGIEMVQQYLRPRHRVVVFDLATNDTPDPQLFERNLQVLRKQIGKRQLVLVNSSKYRLQEGQCVPPNSAATINSIIRRFVQSDKRTKQVLWANTVRRSPYYFNADCIHFTTEGYKKRVQMITDAVKTLL